MLVKIQEATTVQRLDRRIEVNSSKSKKGGQGVQHLFLREVMFADAQPFTEKLFEKSLLGYHLVVEASVADFLSQPQHWKVVDEKAQLEIILIDELSDPFRLDSERKFEAIVTEGWDVEAWDIVRVMRVGSGFDFWGFGLPPASASGGRSTKLNVNGKVGPTDLKFWRAELEHFEPAKHYIFCKKEEQHREELVEKINSLEGRLCEIEDEHEIAELREEIQKIRQELYGKWADYDLEKAMAEMKSAIVENWHGQDFELDAETFEAVKTMDEFIEEGTVTVEVGVRGAAHDGTLYLRLKYYNGESTFDHIAFSHSETVSHKAIELIRYPDIQRAVGDVRKKREP